MIYPARGYKANMPVNVPGISGCTRWTYEIVRDEFGMRFEPTRKALEWSARTIETQVTPKYYWESPRATWTVRVKPRMFPFGWQHACRRRTHRAFVAELGWRPILGDFVWRTIAVGLAKSMRAAIEYVEHGFDFAREVKLLGKSIYSDPSKWRTCYPFNWGPKLLDRDWGNGSSFDHTKVHLKGHGWSVLRVPGRRIAMHEQMDVAKQSFGANACMVADDSYYEDRAQVPHFIWLNHSSEISGHVKELPTLSDFFASAVASSSIEDDD